MCLLITMYNVCKMYIRLILLDKDNKHGITRHNKKILEYCLIYIYE